MLNLPNVSLRLVSLSKHKNFDHMISKALVFAYNELAELFYLKNKFGPSAIVTSYNVRYLDECFV